MAIRYCGDVEVRVQKRVLLDTYEARVRAPAYSKRVTLEVPEVEGKKKRDSFLETATRHDYDTAARMAIQICELEDGELPVELDGDKRLVVRRVFQSACPAEEK
jgi:hypothetical protein